MIFRIFHSDINPGVRHGVLGDVYQQIFKDSVGSLRIQRKNHLFLWELPAEEQICSLNLILKFQLYLAKQADNVHIYDIKLDSLACSLADLKEIFNEQLQPVGLLVQDLDIFLLILCGQIRILQQVYIGNDSRERRLQIMRHIGNQVCFHFSAFYFFVHSFPEAGADFVDFLTERLKDA